MSTTTPEGPSDRELALHEIKSLADQMRQSNLHVYSKDAWRRDRTIGWALTVIILAGLCWAMFYQYASAQDLRRSLYRSCSDANVRTVAQRDFYTEIAAASDNEKFKAMLVRTIDKLEPVDCSARYLR